MIDLLLNLVIFVLTAVLVFRMFRTDGAWNPARGFRSLRFFTTLSNLFCAVAALLLCLFPDSRLVWMLKYTGTAAVTVTLMTVFVFLAPALGKGGLARLLNGSALFMHLLTPLAALATFCLLERRGMTPAQALWGMVPVLIYGTVYLYKVIFAPENRRWEDFYGFNRSGKWPLSYALLAAGSLLICFGLMTVQNL